MSGMSLEITEELIARQSPEAQAIIRALLAKIQQLQDQLNQSPRNSSVPPSTQHPHAKPPRPQSPAARRPGGQTGHPRHERLLLPSGQCDEVIPLKPTACRRCGRELSGEDPAPLRHQVWELPEIKPQIVEYQRHRLACPCCRETLSGFAGGRVYSNEVVTRVVRNKSETSPVCSGNARSNMTRPDRSA